MAKRRRPTEGAPGDQELQEMCDHAAQVKDICDALGFEFRGHRHLEGLLRGGIHKGLTFGELEQLDVLDRPYIWDVED